MHKIKATTKKGPVAVRISLVRGEKSTLHSGRKESKLNVKVFIASKVESISGGQFTPLRTPSASLDSPAMRRMQEKDCKPDKMSLTPFAAAMKGGKESVDDKIANIIKQATAKMSSTMSFDSGHFLHSKLSE
jgi:hypothetical protein